MNHKTDRPEIPAVFRPWLLFLALATLAIVFLTPGLGGKERHQVSKEFQLTVFPWMPAGHITISNGLDTFSGISPNPISEGQRATMLIGLVLSLVVGPTLLLVAWRQWKTTMVPRRWHPPALLLGGVLVVSTMVPPVILAASQWNALESMRRVQDLSRERDLMIHALGKVGRDALQFRILPSSLGGGDGTFRGYRVSEDMKQSDAFSCELIMAADTMITLRAVSASGSRLQITGNVSSAGVMRFDFQESEE
ncbi:MAG: hypothetical protein WEB33_12070 [Bacteroidota bacterium]